MTALDRLDFDVVELVPAPACEHAAPALLRETNFHANAWLPGELDELRRRFAADQSDAEIAAALHRTEAAVAERRIRLGLRRHSRRSWTELEHEQLRRCYGAEPAADIALRLGRSCPAVYLRAAALGLATRRAGPIGKTRSSAPARGKRWLAEEDELLRRAYAAGTSLTPLRAVLGRSRASITWRAGELGLRGTHPDHDGWRGRVWTPDEDDYLRAHYGEDWGASKRIAAHLDRPRSGVLQRAWVLGLRHPGARRYSDDELRAIRIAHAAGISISDLADALGRAPEVVSRTAIGLGIPFAQRARRGPRTRRATRPRLTLAYILALEKRAA